MGTHIGQRLPDLIGAGLIILLGVFAYAQGAAYDIGTIREMGPGYFPRILSVGLIAMGLLYAFVTWRADPVTFGEDRPAPLSILIICASLIVFALLIERNGLVPAIFFSTLLSTFASDKRNIPVALLLSALTALACAAIFIWGLSLPFKYFAI